MTEFERRIWRQLHSLMDGFSKWFAGMRDTDAAKRATSAVHDMRDSDAGKKAASTLNDLRDSDAGKRAASALTDLRQREPVRKAEESARKAFHDLRAGRGADAS
jgi:hypothetical protein